MKLINLLIHIREQYTKQNLTFIAQDDNSDLLKRLEPAGNLREISVSRREAPESIVSLPYCPTWVYYFSIPI
jgi:hypothetical protein